MYQCIYAKCRLGNVYHGKGADGPISGERETQKVGLDETMSCGRQGWKTIRKFPIFGGKRLGFFFGLFRMYFFTVAIHL